MKASNLRSGRLLAVLVLILLAVALAACKPSTPAPTSVPTTAATATSSPVLTLADFTVPIPTPIVINLDGARTTGTGLQYLEETAGLGELPKAGDVIVMNFIASLPDGTELQNTYTQGQPVTTVWGAGRLLPGWEEGVGLTAKVGTKAKLVLPAAIAFGEDGGGSIPPNTQLILEVELMKSEAAPVPTEVSADKLINPTAAYSTMILLPVTA